MKKHHWHVFRHEKLFEKQPLPHCQTPSKACPMLWAHFPFLNGKKKRKTKKNDEIQTLRDQVKQSALCLEQQKKHVGSVIQVMAFFINEFKDTILRGFFLIMKKRFLMSIGIFHKFIIMKT
jgi:hypothetical protein